jgi:hypothetical protein
MCNEDVSTHVYHELADFDTIEQVFEGKKGAILLYETQRDVGHWVLLLDYREDQGYIEFFDSYGLPLDSELGLIPAYYRGELNEDTPHLTHLLSGYVVKENSQQLQRFYETVNTCGRHVVVRFKFFQMGYELEEYTHLFTSQNIDADLLVTKQTFFL